MHAALPTESTDRVRSTSQRVDQRTCLSRLDPSFLTLRAQRPSCRRPQIPMMLEGLPEEDSDAQVVIIALSRKTTNFIAAVGRDRFIWPQAYRAACWSGWSTGFLPQPPPSQRPRYRTQLWLDPHGQSGIHHSLSHVVRVGNLSCNPLFALLPEPWPGIFQNATNRL